MNCYLCGRADLEVLTEQLRRGPGRVLYCSDCDLAQLDRQNSPGELADYYREEYRLTNVPVLGQATTPKELFETYRHYQGTRLRHLRPFLNPDSRLLEIGCSAGQFLYNVRDSVAEAVGVDYDTTSAEYAAKVSGCRTFGVGLTETDLARGYFNVICLFQTVEHLADPVAELALVSEYLAVDGTICIEVPSLGDPLRVLYDIEAYRRFYYHEAHTFYFSPRSLMEVMRRCGFSGEVRHVQDYNFLNHLHWYHRSAPQDSCHPGLGPAELDLVPDVPDALRSDLRAWARRADEEYKALLARHGCTENIMFIGKAPAAREVPDR